MLAHPLCNLQNPPANLSYELGTEAYFFNPPSLPSQRNMDNLKKVSQLISDRDGNQNIYNRFLFDK
jgi:hypothetical protein